MWALVITLLIIGFIYSVIVSNLEEDPKPFLTYFVLCLLVVPFIWIPSTNGKYLTKDIRVSDNVQYKKVEYGKVDSIGYYVNGELIQYNEINKVD